MMATMRAVCLEREGGPEHLHIKTVPRPVPAAGEVLVKVHSASINAVEKRLRLGFGRDWIARPYMEHGQIVNGDVVYISGSDFSGVVEAVGASADMQVGTAVFGGAAPNSGANAEYLVFKSAALAVKPDGISFDDAAALSLAGQSAWSAVMEHVTLQPGNRVFIQQAAGGVGHLAVQLAKRIGAYVIATASPSNFDFVRSLGADEVVDYRTQWDTNIRDITLVIDGVSADNAARAYKMMTATGAVLVSLFDPPPPAPAGIRTTMVNTVISRERMNLLAELVLEGDLKVVVSKTWTLEEVGIAQETSVRGKSVIHID